MFQYRQVLVRMRAGDTDREVPRARKMGRRRPRRSGRWRARLAAPDNALPDEAAIAQ